MHIVRHCYYSKTCVIYMYREGLFHPDALTPPSISCPKTLEIVNEENRLNRLNLWRYGGRCAHLMNHHIHNYIVAHCHKY